MIEILKRQLEEEKRKKREVVNILDKRIKCLEINITKKERWVYNENDKNVA